MAGSFNFDASHLRKLSRDFLRVDPAAVKAAKAVIRAAAVVVLEEAKANSSYSTRIPASGKVRMLGLNAKIVFGGDTAPDAAPIENRGKGHVRHPLFGNKNFWYENPQPAFLTPAFERHQAELDALLAEAVVEATKAVLET